MELIRHDEQAGIMIFKVSQVPLSKSDIRQLIDPDGGKLPKSASVYELVLTVRTLVSSSIQFDDSTKTTSEACTIAAAMKFQTKDGKHLGSNGNAEKMLLKRLKDVYAAHGLAY
jgi:hypothetical protein